MMAIVCVWSLCRITVMRGRYAREQPSRNGTVEFSKGRVRRRLNRSGIEMPAKLFLFSREIWMLRQEWEREVRRTTGSADETCKFSGG